MSEELASAGLAFPKISHNWEFFDFVEDDGKSFVGSENQIFLSWYCLFGNLGSLLVLERFGLFPYEGGNFFVDVGGGDGEKEENIISLLYN